MTTELLYDTAKLIGQTFNATTSFLGDLERRHRQRQHETNTKPVAAADDLLHRGRHVQEPIKHRVTRLNLHALNSLNNLSIAMF